MTTIYESLSPADRKGLVAAITDGLSSLQGAADERRHLLDVLGFVSGRIHDAQTKQSILALEAQLHVLQLEMAALQRQGTVFS